MSETGTVHLQVEGPVGTLPAGRPEEILEAADVQALPWRVFAEQEGVAEKVLWQDAGAGSYAGMLSISPGSSVRLHRHRTAAHHLTVIRGSCRIGGIPMERGSYAFVPAGTWHGISEAGHAGCEIFFLHLCTE